VPEAVAVAAAELQLGRALAAEPGHADRDAYGAAKVRTACICTAENTALQSTTVSREACRHTTLLLLHGHRIPACCGLQAFMRGLEADPGSSMLQDALEEVSRTLTLEQVSQVSLFAMASHVIADVTSSQCRSTLQVYSTAACQQAREELLRGGCIGSTAAPTSAGGCTTANYRLEITLQFPEVHPHETACTGKTRRECHACHLCSIACSSLHAALHAGVYSCTRVWHPAVPQGQHCTGSRAATALHYPGAHQQQQQQRWSQQHERGD
jgi:hypothetical protein